MKKIILVVAVFLMIFAFGAVQALAAGQQKDTQSQSGQSSQQFGQSEQKGGAAGTASGQAGQSMQSGQSGQKGAGAQISRASDLMDKKVVNQQGQDLGEVEDLVIGKDGRIGYIIVSQGGVLGVGDKYTPVPFRSAQLDSQQQHIVLNMDKQTLQSAPTISKSDWQRLGDPSFEQEVFSYYGSSQQRGMSGSQPLDSRSMQPGQRPMPETSPGQTGK